MENRGMRGIVAAVVVLAGSAMFGFWTQAHGASRTMTSHPQRYRAFSRVWTSHKIVALTIDDGPDARITPLILDVLRRNGVHATFFDVGKRMLASPSIVAAEVASGNEVANHTFDHARLPRLGTNAAVSDIERGDAVFRSLGLARSQWFRPPFGDSTEAIISRLHLLHHREVMWTLPLDRFLGREDAAAAARDLAARVQPGDIILAHDCCSPFDRMRTVAALDVLLPELKEQGYSVVTVSELVARGRV